MSLRAAIAEGAGLSRRLKRRPPEQSRVQASAGQINSKGIATHQSQESDLAVMERARVTHKEGRLHLAPARDLRTIIDQAWAEPKDSALAADCISQILGRARKTLDTRMAETYLQRFPVEHPNFECLRLALLKIASRDGSRWKYPAERWNLFDPVAGPANVGSALIDLDPQCVVQDSGLARDLLSGGFVRAAWRHACAEVAESDGNSAPQRIKALVLATEIVGDLPTEHAHYARALLKPWAEQSPTPSMKRFIIGELTGRIGDPRLERNRWRGLSNELQRLFPGDDIFRLFGRLHFWLVENAIHQFLDVVDHDADPEQWPYRKAFWLSYLKAGHVKDAWVAFGPAAADRARDLTESSKAAGRLYADLSGGYQPTQSVLLLRIDDLIVGDWSHTGRCRFWTKDSKSGARLMSADGGWLAHYRATQLRTLDVNQLALKTKAQARARAERYRALRPDHEESHSGAKSFTWQRAFNEVIGELTDFRVHFEYDSLYPFERNLAWEPARGGRSGRL